MVPPQPYPGEQGNFPAPPGYPAQPGHPQQPYPALSGYPVPQIQPYQEMRGQCNTTASSHEAFILRPEAPRPQNWRTLSIFNLVFCLWPISVATFVFSSKVDSSYIAGDYEGARRNSKISLCLNLLSILCLVSLAAYVFRSGPRSFNSCSPLPLESVLS
ncbi:unnamed protein product, partial [Porites lobata]